MRSIFILNILIWSFGIAYSQPNCDKYTENYIPKNLNDALAYLDCKWSDRDKEEFKNKNERGAVTDLHFGAGLAIRNYWDLWKKRRNPLARYFNRQGIYHPDDISSIILTSFHRHLKNNPIDLDGQIKYFQNYWKEANEKYENEHTILTDKKRKEFESYQKGDTVKIAFKLYTNQKYPQVYPIQGNPDLNEESNCYVTAIVTGKRIQKGHNYTLKILPIDICGYQEIYWSSIHEKYGNFRVGEEYNFFSLTAFKIRRL